jgi:uncharacterized protein YbjQ (UPF0145 family)
MKVPAKAHRWGLASRKGGLSGLSTDKIPPKRLHSELVELSTISDGSNELSTISHGSTGIRLARSSAMRRVTEMARQLNASGVVGMHIECKREIKEERKHRHSLWVYFSVVGTAIGRKIGNHIIPKPRPTLSLTDVRPGQYGETPELTIREE